MQIGGLSATRSRARRTPLYLSSISKQPLLPAALCDGKTQPNLFYPPPPPLLALAARFSLYIKETKDTTCFRPTKLCDHSQLRLPQEVQSAKSGYYC